MSTPKTLRSLCAAASALTGLSLLLVAGPAAAQQAPQVTLDVTAPAEITVGDYVNYSITYTITGGDLEDLVIVADLPPGVEVIGTAQPPGAVPDCVEESEDDWICTFTLNFAPGGLSGQFLIQTDTRRWTIPDGTVLEIPVTFDATYEDAQGAGVAMPTVTDSAETLVDATPDPLLWDEVHDPIWISHPETGEPGLSFWYLLRVMFTSQANAPIEAGWTLQDVLPPELLFLEWKGDKWVEVEAPEAWTNGTLTLAGAQDLTTWFEADVRVWIACRYLPITLQELGHSWGIEGTEILAEGTDEWTATHVTQERPHGLGEHCHLPDT